MLEGRAITGSPATAKCMGSWFGVDQEGSSQDTSTVRDRRGVLVVEEGLCPFVLTLVDVLERTSSTEFHADPQLL